MTAVLTAGLSWWVLTRTEMQARRWFGGLMVVLSVWAAISAVGVFALARPFHELFAIVWAVGGQTTVFVWLVFVVDYTNGNPWTNRFVRVFLAAYLGLLAVTVTMPAHDRYHASLVFRTEPFPHIETTPGLARIAALVYTLLGVVVGTYYLLDLFSSTRYKSRRQTLVLSNGIALGTVPAVASLAGLTPVPTHNHTIFGVSGFVLVVTYAIFRHSFAELAPIARDVVVAGIEDPLFIIDGDTRVVDHNDAAGRVVPALDSGSIGTEISTLVPQLADVRPGTDCPEMLTLTVDGTPRHYSVRVSEVAGERSARGYVVVLRDVTRRTVRERELEAARRELEQSNERLEEFASVVSHDLRNPLNVATLRLELARERDDSEHLAAVAQAHERMGTLIDNLLQLARSGTEVDNLQRVSIAEFAHSCWHTVETADATLAIEADNMVRADPDRLRQLLENLLRNAVDHGPTDVTVTVGVLDNGFYVADDGPGVPDEDRNRILERGYSTTSNGTGLGLSIVTGIAEAHGWGITVTESENGGARFEFTGVDLSRSVACQG